MTRSEQIEQAARALLEEIYDADASDGMDMALHDALEAALALPPEAPRPVLACSHCGWTAEPCEHIGAWLKRHGPVNENESAPAPDAGSAPPCPCICHSAEWGSSAAMDDHGECCAALWARAPADRYAEGLEAAARLAEEWANQYPEGIWRPGGASLDAKAAGHGRRVAANIARDIRALAAPPDAPAPAGKDEP